MEFVCNVLVVADQLLITRLKEICEVTITENCKFTLSLNLAKLSLVIEIMSLEIIQAKREKTVAM